MDILYSVSSHSSASTFWQFGSSKAGKVKITEEEKCFIDTYVNFYCNENENMQIKDMVT